MKTSRTLSLLLATALLVSCGLPSKIPASVTDPQAIALFNRAKAGDSDAQYQVGMMYKNGTHGFPQSESRARDIFNDATYGDNPSAAACYEMFLYWKKSNAQFPSDFKERQVQHYFEKATKYGDPRATSAVQAVADARREEEESYRRYQESQMTCPLCKGEGGKWETDYKNVVTTAVYKNHRGEVVESDWGHAKVKIPCERCNGRGTIDRY